MFALRIPIWFARRTSIGWPKSGVDAPIAESKEQMHFIAFDGEVGLRKLLVTK